MNQPRRQWLASPKQLVGLIIVLIVLYLLAGVLNTFINYMNLVQQVNELEAANAANKSTIEQMRDQIEYMQSDAYVEIAAKSMLLWGRPGEKLLIPLSKSPQPSPTVVPRSRP